MFQQLSSILPNRSQQILWLGILTAIITLLLTQSAQAAVIRLQIIFVHAPQQQVDTDGDGNLDPFSADFAVYNDGTAEGTIRLNAINHVTLKRGVIGWTPEGEKAVLTGVQYQRVNGQWLEIGLAQVEVKPAARPAGGQGVDIIIFDIVDAANHAASFEVIGDWQRDYVAGMMAPAAQVDTGGDGEMDTFSADVLLLNDGLATGMVELDSDSRIILESGAAYCLAGEAVVVAYGTHYQEVDGLWLETGDGRVHGRPTGGGGADIVVFDIVDAANHSHSFQSPGDLLFVADPCAG